MFRVLNKHQMHRYSKCKVPTLNMKTEVLYLSHRYKSHYTSLGLEPSASVKDIKSAYYNLSLKHHPDKNQGSADSAEKFRKITEAYEILCNPEKKRIYDRDLNLYSDQGVRSNFYPRSSNYYRASTSRTGRTEHYNYEEHFKQHYEEFYRQRATEQEHFRRRWEAEQRYRYGDQHTWSSRYSTEDQYRGRRYRMNPFWLNKSFVYFMTFWIILLMSGELLEMMNPETRKTKRDPVYYKTNANDDKRE